MQQLNTPKYYALVVDNTTFACFLPFQETTDFTSKRHVLLLLFLCNFHPAKSKSIYQTKSQSAPLGYHIWDQVPITALKAIVVSKGAIEFPYRKKPSAGCA